MYSLNKPKFLDLFTINLYSLQHQINAIITNQLNHLTITLIVLLVISGIITSINPCSISTIPIAIGYLNTDKKEIYKIYLIFAGILSSFIIITLTILLFNIYYQKLSSIIPIILSMYMIFIGLSLLKIMPINLPPLMTNINKIIRYKNYEIVNHYITGIVLGINSSSCSTPILTTITFWLSKSKDTTLGYIYIICYVVGYTLPILFLLSLAINYIEYMKTNIIWRYIMIINGCTMLGLGISSLMHIIFT